MDYEDTISPSDAKELPKYKELLATPFIFKADRESVYEIIVSNPQVQSNQYKNYIAYSVQGKNTKDGSTFESYRRYSDFLWLHDILRRTMPACVVPGMPEKSLMGNFSPSLLVYRIRELTRFLQRIAAHPTLSGSEYFRLFLYGSWADIMSRRSLPLPPAVGPTYPYIAPTGFFGSFFSSYDPRSDDVDPWFSTQLTKLESIETTLKTLLDSSNEMYNKWGKIGEYEAENSTNIRLVGSAVGRADELSATRMGFVGIALEYDSKLSKEYSEKLEHNVHDDIKDYLLEIEEIKSVIKKRDDYIASCSSTYRESKANKFSQELKHEYEVAKTELESFSGFARKEIERVCAIREKSFAVTLDNFRTLTADYASKTSKSLKTAAMTPVDGGLESVPGVRIRQKKQTPQKNKQEQEQDDEQQRSGSKGQKRREDEMYDDDDDDNAFISPYSIGDD